MKETDKIQNLLPFGYLFLVVMGILKESVLFYQIGIPILKYSSIMDILISPVATMTSHYVILIFLFLLFLFYSKLPTILMKYSDKKWIQKFFDLDASKITITENERKNYFTYVAIKSLAVMLLSFFVGYGLAEGRILSQKIKNDKLKYNCNLIYASGQQEVVSMINTNSAYCFYLSKGNQNVKIAPIGSIRNIELINTKK